MGRCRSAGGEGGDGAAALRADVEAAGPGGARCGGPAVGVGPGDGVLLLKDLMNYNVKNNATEVYDGTTVSTYSYSGTAWIGYDGATSVREKIHYAQGLNLGGYFFWALGYDKDWIISQHGINRSQ